MKELKDEIANCKKKDIKGNKCPKLDKIKFQYLKNFNISPQNCNYIGTMTEVIGIKIANAYAELKHLPDDILVSGAYRQMIKELINQFDFLNQNVKIAYEPFKAKGEPYKNSHEMLKDIIYNHHLYFFKTENGFGENDSSQNNLMLDKIGIRCENYELLVNDVFRIVHDIFGHAMEGYSFGPIGEDQAWFTHTQMFSPLAASAITTETRGQNCWVNFGNHMRDENGNIFKRSDLRYILPKDRPFAKQKMNLLPSHITGIQVYEEKGVPVAELLPNWNPFFII